MKTAKKKPTATQLTLRALTRASRQLAQVAALAHTPPVYVRQGPARFIQCWAVHGRPVTQALDEDGTVWELHTIFDNATKQVSEQFWTPLGMERRKT